MYKLTGILLALAACVAFAAEDTPKTDKPEKKKWDVNNPPGERTTVKLDTRTGTWMSVDVSPDGKTLVFDLLGDLYTLPIEGGEAKALTSGIAFDMQARFSPDGKRIAYMSDAGGGDNIWVMDADGKNAKAITKETFRLLNNPVWHPDGQFIAARKHFTGTRSLGSGEIWMYHAGSVSEGVQLNEKPNWQKDLGEPAFSPDGRYLYYSQDTTPGNTFEYNKDGNKQIYQIQRRDLKEGKTRAFVSGPGGAVRPTPSPDGKYLAFVRRVRNQSTLFLKDLASGEEWPAWAELERDLQESWAVHGVYPAFAWLPGSREVVVWAKGKLWRVDPFAKAAKEIPFHVTGTRDIVPALRVAHAVSPDKFEVRNLRWATVSPAGDRVVYSALGQLYTRALPDGTPQRLTKESEFQELFPAFSRDGTRLVYTTWNDQKQGGVRVLDLKTGKSIDITREPGKYAEPAFSPDGKQVAYLRATGGFLLNPWNGTEAGIFIAAADGKGAPRKVADDARQPQWSRDGESLYLTRLKRNGEEESTTQLVRLELLGGNEQVVAQSEFATDFAVSPDGKWLAFRERFHAHVVPLPLAGKTITLKAGTEALPSQKLDVNAGDHLHWSGDSQSLHFTLGNELFTRPLKEAFAFVAGGKVEKPAEQGAYIGFTQAAARASGIIVISGARIATMKGDEIIEDGRIVIDGDRIRAVGSAKDIAVPAGARSIDARGKTIIPGMVDVHWHGRMGENGIVPQQSWVNYASLAFGVTTLHDPSNDTATIWTASEMQRAGLIVAPRIWSTGTVLYGAKSNQAAVINGLEDATTHLKRIRAAGATTVKSYNQPRRDQRQQVIAAARDTGMMVVPEGGSLFHLNMNMIIDGHTGIEHALPVANVYDDVVQLWSQSKSGYTPTLGVAFGGLDGEHYWYARTEAWKHPLLTKYVPRGQLEARAVRRETAPDEDYNVFNVARHAVKLQRAGVPVNIGAHGQREGLAAHWELWTLVMGGMTPLEAIRSATLNPASYLGMDRDVGSLEPGKLADLVVIDGDVLKDIRVSDRVSQVMIGGRLYDAGTMNEIAPGARARKPFFFESARGSAAAVGVESHAESHGHCSCEM